MTQNHGFGRGGRLILLVLFSPVVLAGCGDPEPVGRADVAAACAAPALRELVGRFGERLNQVSLLGPDSLVTREIRESYGGLVTPELLAEWQSNPAAAPGRRVSSPWPERIEIQSIEAAEDGACRVEGEVLYVTAVESAGGAEAASREPVALRMRGNGAWRISGYHQLAGPESIGHSAGQGARQRSPGADAAAGAAGGTPGADALDVIRQYYAAIDDGRFREAYALWEGDGAASGESFEAFAAGFAETAVVRVELGEPGRIQGAAGSQYVDVPATISALTRDSVPQRFEGTYTLRRAVVDGASAEQRRWHIYSADVVRRD